MPSNRPRTSEGFDSSRRKSAVRGMITQVVSSSAPADGCATYAVCLQELEAFERDLHAHVHLENNILFPKESALEASRA